MVIEIDITLKPEDASNETAIRKIIAEKIQETDFQFAIIKKSIDARSRNVKILHRVKVYIREAIPVVDLFIPRFPSVKDKKQVAIAGAGPAGLFAALALIEQGIKPVIFERGKSVRERRHDLAKINKEGFVNPESNYCFGEGGAGTYSDGKLYTRSDKRGDVKHILETFVRFGADKNILIEAHPHIGTNKLPAIITSIRETIINAGGAVYFDAKLTDIHSAFDQLNAIEINGADKFSCDTLILATGHSARDIFHLLQKRNIPIEAKPFALGVRIEHPQQLIDAMQYHCDERGPFLPPSSYSIVQQVGERGVYSFCMCPGGIIAPCATANEEVVTNGWSPSKRNNPFANSGFVVNVTLADLANYEKYDALAGIFFQKEIEHACYLAGGGDQKAPAQRMVDFVNKKNSLTLPDCSYQPGIQSVQLDDILPGFISESLRRAFSAIQKTKPLFFTNEAVCVAVESRTSSPVRIPRNSQTLEHPQLKGLYPCAEGAGYAGGIVSAAMDGRRIAALIAK